MVDKNKILERFMKYVEFDTHSIDGIDTPPSNPVELDFANYLKDELLSIGVDNVEIDDKGFLYASIDASKGYENKPSLAFITHLDITSEVPSDNVKVVLKNLEDGDILIKSDGTTLLGADDKAGIAEVITAMEVMIENKELMHPRIVFVATVDEETGTGIDYIDLNKVNSCYAYTIDGETIGEIEYENFYAETAKVEFNGYNVHSGNAYGIMKNAIIMSNEFVTNMPENIRPEKSRNRDGFVMIDNIAGNATKTTMTLLLRSFNDDEINNYKNELKKIKDTINKKYGKDSCKIFFEHDYDNMVSFIIPKKQFMVDFVKDVYTELGIKIIDDPIRGGTDGANLTLKGLPCPNIGTGAINIHSVDEQIKLSDMIKVTKALIMICEKYANLNV